MGSIKKKIGIAVSAVGLCIVAATFVSVVSANSTDKVEIRLAHNQAAGSEIADSIAKFSEFVAEDDSMNLDVNIYASGVLGSEKEEIDIKSLRRGETLMFVGENHILAEVKSFNYEDDIINNEEEKNEN